MIADVTIKSKDFSLIHNSLCRLRDASESSKKIKHSDLRKIVETLYGALGDAYKQDWAAHDKASDYWRGVADQRNYTSIWSMYEVKSCQDPHPYQGHTALVYDTFWGDANSIEVAINGSTWLDLYDAADRVIYQSGDEHHIFIENFYVEDGVLKLSTGS